MTRFGGNCVQRQLFDQLGDAGSVSLGITEKFDAELAVLAPADDGDFDGEGRGLLGRVDVQGEIGSRLHSDSALHPASRRRKIKEQAFSCRVVGLDADRITHMNSWAATGLHHTGVKKASAAFSHRSEDRRTNQRTPSPPRSLRPCWNSELRSVTVSTCANLGVRSLVTVQPTFPIGRGRLKLDPCSFD